MSRLADWFFGPAREYERSVEVAAPEPEVAVPEPEPEMSFVRLHLVDGSPSFEGILVGENAGHYRLLNARMLEGDEPPVLDGESFVLRERVLFVQVLSS